MANEATRKICVILGAGASHDVRNAGSPVLNPGLQPPLARDLFDLERHSAFRPILAEYEGAVVLAQDLAARSELRDFDLEKELRRIAGHPSDQVREHYKHIPPYLRDLLMMCSYEYTSYPSCYIRLVQVLLAEHPSDVLFLVLNYDDLLEQALYQFSSGVVKFESLEDYIRPSYPVKVVKLHGSINWFKPIGPVNNDWHTYVRREDVLTKSEDRVIQVMVSHGKSDKRRTHQIEISGQRGYPILTAPLAGKGTAAMVCPDGHLAVARDFLQDCSRFLVVGCSGSDDDLLDLLKGSVRSGRPWVQFVNGSEAAGNEVRQRFSNKVGSFSSISVVDGQIAFNGGFAGYVGSDFFTRFLKASI